MAADRTEVGFYHLTQTPLERALPKLLERVLAQDGRAVVITGNEDRVEALTAALWTYDDRAWLPHGSAADGHAENQPIWLTASDENPNGATFLFLTDGAESAQIGAFSRTFDLFDGRDEAAVSAARTRWRACKDAGYALTYWKQTDGGSWAREAES